MRGIDPLGYRVTCQRCGISVDLACSTRGQALARVIDNWGWAVLGRDVVCSKCSGRKARELCRERDQNVTVV